MMVSVRFSSLSLGGNEIFYRQWIFSRTRSFGCNGRTLKGRQGIIMVQGGRGHSAASY